MKQLKLDPVRHLAIPVALLAMVAIALLAETLPLGGRAPRELLAMFETLLTPAPWALSIWWFIFSGLAAFTLYQFLPSQADDPVVNRVNSLVLAGSLLFIGCLLAWHFTWLGVSAILLVPLLIAVILIYSMVTRRKQERTPAQRLMVALPFRIYLGWLILILPVTLLAWCKEAGTCLAQPGELGWALISIGAIVVTGAVLLLLKRDLFVNLPLIWGLVAIGVAQTDETAVLVTALLGAAILLALIVLQIMRNRRTPAPAAAPVQTPLNGTGR